MWGAQAGQGLIRASGAAQALGAPKAQPKAAAKPKPAGGKPQGQKPQHPGGVPQKPKPPGGVPFYQMNPAQLHQYAAKTVGEGVKAELQPFKAKAGEIQNQEQTVSKRFGGYGETADKQLGGLQDSQQASAKTFANSAADSALKALQSVETTGQNTAQANAGYLDPQVKSQLDRERANLAGIGAGQEGTAKALGESGANLLSNIRAAATQRVAEGQQGIASTYGKQFGANRSAENQILGKQTGRAAALETELQQKAFTDKATEQGLGIKIGGLRVNQQNAQTKAGSLNATERRNSLTERGQNLKQQEHAQDLTFKDTHPTGGSTNAPKAPSPAEGRKYMGNVSKAESIVQQQLGPKKFDHKRQEQVRHYLRGLGYNGDQISAAMNLAVYGHLGAKDEEVAASYGLTPAMRAQWFKKAK